MGEERKTLIDARGLAALLESRPDTVLLDVRWALGDAHGRDHYEAGHIPGAIFVDMETELSASGTPQAGRHPLPEAHDLAASARRWGINEDSTVVLYDGTGGLAAARGWWLLRHAGAADVRVLDGGVQGWEAAGHVLETGTNTAAPGNVRLGWGHMPVIDIDAAAAFPGHGILLDSRAAERYRGEVEPIDPRAGHIPGARNRPTTENLGADGHLLAPGPLAAALAGLGVQPGAGAQEVAAYCGSGVTAAHQVLALETIGVHAALYPGSWSQYSSDAARPAATGPTP
ncbi:sulfurtransferase [Paeniglutamicibacter psychrophenolicus]|uniref:Thiosulfate/3-mercaptopyruvate sulfurtransferase n=1 Tax=Paeniglutamicibacter psychrophenolicus TaxID=257454 RepID=A0ABS4WDF5_9MICC|nr:sulfurtransferase [Paeniglutamicibacter psychrophenolicus]MBP2374232.1 thiosulfate/3-mercaptopyruvate sulfurtransferase [Paeniglutamicibacter psychrophenolicus]